MSNIGQKYITDLYRSYKESSGDILSPEIARLAGGNIYGRILDVGAGTGAMMNYLRKRGMEEVVGIDIAPRAKGIINASADNIPFNDEYFDCIIVSEVLEHLDKDVFKRVILEIYRVLKKGGSVIITVPNRENMEHSIDTCPHCGERFHRMGHVQSFNSIDLAHVLDSFGFEIQKVRIIPLAFTSGHKYLKHLLPFIGKMPVIRSEQRNIFMVVKKSQ